ncbi:IucA/IucC family protein [Vreelandella olivaria]|uniref:IucA/IucC family protein n=1 Tax=Vreelandella olivaria TaxID=390919 RepID=UPI00201F1091|nr:IucA/IucC family protein [Halomonas olivaria]
MAEHTALPEHILAAIEQHRQQCSDPMAAFFYDLPALEAHGRAMKEALPPGVELFYAIKANSEAAIVDTLAPIVDGLELSSGGEIERACHSATPRPWVLSGPGKLDSDMRHAMLQGVEAFHVESLGEIARLQSVAAALGHIQPVLLRINPMLPEAFSSRLRMAGTATPFGIDEARLAAAVTAVDDAPNLKLVGFHIHAMSHQKNEQRHQQLLAFYLERWPQWRALARYPEQLAQLNVGGGIGVNYLQPWQQFDWARLCQALGQQLDAMPEPPLVRFEIGRYLSAFCGYYVIEVLDAKVSHGEGFLVCRGGTHQFRLPAAQGHDHPVMHLPQDPQRASKGESQPWTVVGQLCTPKDVLSRHQMLRGVAVGDLLVLPLAGAYGYNISHADFLCHPRPKQLFVGQTTMEEASDTGPTPFASIDSWRHHARIEQRVVGQLLQTLLYEDVLRYTVEPDPTAWLAGASRFSLTLGSRCYQVDGWLCHSFQLIRLDHSTLQVNRSQGAPEPVSLRRFITDLKEAMGDVAIQPGFVNELVQTLIKDTQSSTYTASYSASPQKLGADALEHYFTDAHSYHPCYKSRLGFSLQDNQRYGPEFAQPLQVVWLAVPRRLAHASAVEGETCAERAVKDAGPKVLARLDDYLAQQQCRRDEVVLMPVHPWQWENALVDVLYPELASGEIAFLGEGEAVYTPQQSIRTLAPVESNKPYLKLAMSITNTSSTRILARHTVTNGPIITQWLQRLVSTDETALSAGFVLLGEVAGVALDERAFPAARYADVYGKVGAIWRQNISGFLRDGEQAVPFNGLSQFVRTPQGEPLAPFITPWIEHYGLEAWTQQLIHVATLPVIHMLFAEGVGMESHGQNIVVIHRDGWPTRVALKDFHDGVRFSASHLARPELAPQLEPVPPRHAALNRNSFIVTDDLAAVRDYSCDAFFFIALGEIAIFLHRHFGLEESRFWSITAEVVTQYQRANPQHAERYRCFDVFAPEWEVEALTRRRLFGDEQPQVKRVPNPLAVYALRREAVC